MGIRRLFIAIPVPLAAVSPRDSSPSVSDVINELAAFGKPVRALQPENLHLTLNFIGDTDEALLPDITTALSLAAEDACAFGISFRGLGTFPNLNRPSVVWVGVDPPEPCVRIAEQLKELLVPLGFEPEQRAWRPHLTLARVRSRPPDELRELVTRLDDVEFGALSIDRITLYESELTPGSPIYTPLESAALTPAGGD